MPGRYFLTSPVQDIADWLNWAGPLQPDPPRRNISPGQDVLIYDSDGLGHARWGLIPVGRVNARGRPVLDSLVNARSETVFQKSTFKGLGRAVVPMNGWYEWTGTTRRKQPWRSPPFTATSFVLRRSLISGRHPAVQNRSNRWRR